MVGLRETFMMVQLQAINAKFFDLLSRPEPNRRAATLIFQCISVRAKRRLRSLSWIQLALKSTPIKGHLKETVLTAGATEGGGGGGGGASM
ncbi:unnamed protein product [Mesocestoides corti]|uniref:Uncharacterized protein n=2 Tax=Mesocestoides corti TaxID=53468 RepID=A0A0R3U1R5_MESCO|nr:unnamed protein product [Mesocestoides corti]